MGRTRNVRVSIGLCLAVFALGGCSKPEDAVVGTWTSNQGGVTSTTEFIDESHRGDPTILPMIPKDDK